MIKMVGLLKRRPGMSVDAFRAYYESTHRRIGEKVLAGYATRYVRRYLNPSRDSGAATFGEEGDFDVILEVWYPDEAAAAAALEHQSLPDVAREILDDEMRLFDREKNRFFVLEEVESQLPPL